MPCGAIYYVVMRYIALRQRVRGFISYRFACKISQSSYVRLYRASESEYIARKNLGWNFIQNNSQKIDSINYNRKKIKLIQTAELFAETDSFYDF